MALNTNTAYMQTYLDANAASMDTASVLVLPYTHAEVWEQFTTVYKYVQVATSTEVATSPLTILQTAGFNTAMALLTLPLATADDMKYVFRSWMILVEASETIDGLTSLTWTNFIVMALQQFLTDNAAAILAICGAAATFDEVNSCAQGLLTIESWRGRADVTIPSTYTTAQDDLKTQFDALAITTPAEFRTASLTVDIFRRLGEGEQISDNVIFQI